MFPSGGSTCIVYATMEKRWCPVEARECSKTKEFGKAMIRRIGKCKWKEDTLPRFLEILILWEQEEIKLEKDQHIDLFGRCYIGKSSFKSYVLLRFSVCDISMCLNKVNPLYYLDFGICLNVLNLVGLELFFPTIFRFSILCIQSLQQICRDFYHFERDSVSEEKK